MSSPDRTELSESYLHLSLEHSSNFDSTDATQSPEHTLPVELLSRARVMDRLFATHSPHRLGSPYHEDIGSSDASFSSHSTPLSIRPEADRSAPKAPKASGDMPSMEIHPGGRARRHRMPSVDARANGRSNGEGGHGPSEAETKGAPGQQSAPGQQGAGQQGAGHQGGPERARHSNGYSEAQRAMALDARPSPLNRLARAGSARDAARRRGKPRADPRVLVHRLVSHFEDALGECFQEMHKADSSSELADDTFDQGRADTSPLSSPQSNYEPILDKAEDGGYLPKMHGPWDSAKALDYSTKRPMDYPRDHVPRDHVPRDRVDWLRDGDSNHGIHSDHAAGLEPDSKPPLSSARTPRLSLEDLTSDHIEIPLPKDPLRPSSAHYVEALEEKLRLYQLHNEELHNELQFVRAKLLRDSAGPSTLPPFQPQPHPRSESPHYESTQSHSARSPAHSKSVHSDSPHSPPHPSGDPRDPVPAAEYAHLPDQFKPYYHKLHLDAVDHMCADDMRRMIKNMMLSLLITDFEHLPTMVPKIGKYLSLTTDFLDRLHGSLYELHMKPLDYLRDYNLGLDGLSDCLDGMLALGAQHVPGTCQREEV